MAKKKSASAKKTAAASSSGDAAAATSASTTTAPASSTAAAPAAAPAPASKGTAPAAQPPAPTHGSLQVALLRCAALCVASKSTLRSNDLDRVSTTPLEDVPTHGQILFDARALFKRLASTANALALAVKVSAAETKAEAAKIKAASSTSTATASNQSGPGSPLAGLDSGSIAAAQAQLDILTTELLPKLVYVSRKCTKESLVQHASLPAGQSNTQASWGGLGQAFAKAVNRAVREVVDSVDAFIECFMDVKTRAAMLAAEQARYRAAVDRGEEEMGQPARPQAHPRINDLTPAALRKRALIRYDALYKLCERLADPNPPADPPLSVESYADLLKGSSSSKKNKDDKGDDDDDDDDDEYAEDDADKLDRFEVTLAKNFMNEHVRGLPRDNWEALQRYHVTRAEQLQDAVREMGDVLRWAKKKKEEEEEKKKEKERKEGGDDGEEGSTAAAEAGSGAGGMQNCTDSDLDDFEYLALDEYAPADVDRAKRALPVVERVVRVHTLVGTLFSDPAVRPQGGAAGPPPPARAGAGGASMGYEAYDKLAEQADVLLEDVDELIGYSIYAGDAETDARQVAEDAEEDRLKSAAAAAAGGAKGDAAPAAGKTWEEKEEDRKKNGDHRPFDPAVAEALAEDAESLFAEHLVAFAQSGAELAKQGAVAVVGAGAGGSELVITFKTLADEIEAECKTAVGPDVYEDYAY
ncbi:Kynureninase (L-kynurenine hydrolase) [Tilletia horrida]|nr:Kynureninase (L-kynurenine hydrolase) [Tilletia horrida]